MLRCPRYQGMKRLLGSLNLRETHVVVGVHHAVAVVLAVVGGGAAVALHSRLNGLPSTKTTTDIPFPSLGGDAIAKYSISNSSFNIPVFAFRGRCSVRPILVGEKIGLEKSSRPLSHGNP